MCFCYTIDWLSIYVSLLNFNVLSFDDNDCLRHDTTRAYLLFQLGYFSEIICWHNEYLDVNK